MSIFCGNLCVHIFCKSFFLNKFIYFIYLFLAVLGFRCCGWAFCSCSEGRGLLFVAVCWLFIAVTSLVAEHAALQQLQNVGSAVMTRGLQQLWLTGSRAQAQQLWSTGLVAPWHVGSSRTRARAHVPCIGRRILNHYATREVPANLFNWVVVSLFLRVLYICWIHVLFIKYLICKYFYLSLT